MKNNVARTTITNLLELANISVNGTAPWDLQIHNEQFYDRVLRDRDLGFGETYMEGWWDSPRLDLLIERAAKAQLDTQLKPNLRLAFTILLSRLFNRQTRKRALEVGKRHYDLGNDLFTAMLDSNMNYTCGYWKNAQTLDEAQLAKLDLVCRKLLLKPGMRVLDIGCGWGSLAKYMAEHYGVEVVGITISRQQYELAKERCKNLAIDIRFQDYRELNEPFERIVSLGMFEHVGYRNYRNYMQIVNRCLKDEGLFLLHTIGNNESTTHTMPWIGKYIFPNGMIPSIVQIGKATEKLLVMEDWHNFGPDYYKTLMAWHENFNAHWEELQGDYDEQFFRMWNYYLLFCAGGFKARVLQLWQIVFSKAGLKTRYDAAR